MNTKKISETCIIFIGLVVLVFILREFQNFLRPLTIALLLSFFFTPIYRLSKGQKWKTIIKNSFFVLLVVAFIVIFGMVLVNRIATLSSNGFMIDEEILEGLTLEIGELELSLANLVSATELKDTIFGFVNKAVNSLTVFVSEFLLIILFMIFLIPFLNIWIKNTTKKMDPRSKKKFLGTLFNMESGIRDYLKTKAMISLGTALVSFFVMMFFGVKFFVLFALLIFLLNFIPSIGSIAAVGIVLVAEFLLKGLSVNFLILAILLIIIQVLFGNIIEPKFAGRRLVLSPLIILISLFFWGSIWGVGGMLFSVPLTLGIKILLKHNKSTEEIANLIS